MHITELEDLQVSALERLPIIFGKKDLLEEDVINKSCIEISLLCSELVRYIRSSEVDKRIITKYLNEILNYISIAAYILKVECPCYEDIEENDSEDYWAAEVRQCSILASTMLQLNISKLTLDYFVAQNLDNDEVEYAINNIVSLVNVIAQRYNISFIEVLQH